MTIWASEIVIFINNPRNRPEYPKFFRFSERLTHYTKFYFIFQTFRLSKNLIFQTVDLSKLLPKLDFYFVNSPQLKIKFCKQQIFLQIWIYNYSLHFWLFSFATSLILVLDAKLQNSNTKFAKWTSKQWSNSFYSLPKTSLQTWIIRL